MLPTGGLPGLGVAFGGSVEYQQNWNPHFHGNVHTACVYKHKTMTEIAEMMESNLLTFEALAKYQSWMHREDHFNHDSPGIARHGFTSCLVFRQLEDYVVT